MSLDNVKVCKKHEVEFCGERPCDICRREQVVRELYFSAHWKSDRLNGEKERELWTAVRDAFGITPGESTRKLGNPRFKRED